MPCVQVHQGSVDRDSTSRWKQVFFTRRSRVVTSDLVYHYSIHSPTETLWRYLAAMAQFTKTSARNTPEPHSAAMAQFTKTSPRNTPEPHSAAMAQFTKTSPRNTPEPALPLITLRNFYAYTLSVFLSAYTVHWQNDCTGKSA